MAGLKKSADMTKHYEELGLKYLNYMKHRLSQDGATFRDQIVEWFGKWILHTQKRVARYEVADLKLVDEFLDWAWPSIVDLTKPLLQEPKKEKPQDPMEEIRAEVARPRAVQNQINWREVAQQLYQPGPAANVHIENIAHQWVVFDQNGRAVNR